MKRTLTGLILLTIVAVLALVFLAKKDQPETPRHSTGLLPAELVKNINDIEHVEIIGPGNTPVATLDKKDKGWQVAQLNHYHADWKKLQRMLAALATAKVVEPKTDKPQYYARLGVEDVTDKTATGVLVKIGSGDSALAVIVGHKAKGRQGQYVRLQQAAASALIDKTLEVPAKTLDWVERRIIDINASEVAEVEIIHPDGKRVLVSKKTASQTDFSFDGLPSGKEIKSSWSVNSLGSALSMLDLESVQAVDSIDWSKAVKMRMLMFSGIEIMAEMVADGDKYYLRLHASDPQAAVVKAGTPDEAVTDTADAAASGAEPADGKKADQAGDMQAKAARLAQKAAADNAKKVDEINQRVTGWVYGISKSKFDVLVKKPDDLIKPVKSS